MSQRLTRFQLLRLKSERMRAIGMLLVLSVVAWIGIYHIFYTADEKPGLGWIIIVTTLIFVVFETLFLLIVIKAIKKQRLVAESLRKIEPFVEIVFPVVAMGIIMDVGDNPFTILVSPAYALILIIIAASSLRLNPKTTLYTGLLGSFCYTLLTLRVLYVDHYQGMNLNPHPDRLYIELALMLVIATIVITFITRELKSYVETATQEQVLQGQMKLAGEIQKNLLPSPLPVLPGYETAAFYLPATQTGGDYYDCLIPEPSQLIMTIGDATGHGAGPALITASSRAYLRAISNQCVDLNEIIQQMNTMLYKDMVSGHFVTLATLKLDANTNLCQYLSAGHAPTLFIRGHGGESESLPAQGIPLGVDHPLKLEELIEINLLQGDMIAMFSDGCYECENDEDVPFGISRLTNLLREYRNKPATEIATILQKTIEEFSGSQFQKDDITFLMLKRVG